MAMKIITFRVTSEEAASLIMAAKELQKKKKWRRDYCPSDFIRDAVAEKLAHLDRGRESSKRRSAKDKVIVPRELCEECGLMLDANGHCDCHHSKVQK